MTFETVWRNTSLGILLVAVGALVLTGAEWQWMFVVLAGMSFLNAVVKRRWRRVPHPLMWAGGLAYAYRTEGVSAWGVFWILVGASIILSFFLSRLPERPRGGPGEGEGPPPPPGAGVVIDAEVTARGE